MTPHLRPDGVAFLSSTDLNSAVVDGSLSMAQIVVIGFTSGVDDNESPDSLPAPALEALEWLRSPGRFSIALVQGTCGRQFVSAIASCDIVLMTQSALLVTSASDATGLPGLGASEVVVARIGSGRSLLLALDDAPLDATSAYAIGLVDEVVSDPHAADRVDQLLAQLHAKPAGWMAEATSLLATASGATHEAAGRDRLRRREVDAQERLKRQGQALPD